FCRDLPHRHYRIAELGSDQEPAPNGSTTSKRPGSAITTRSDSGSAWPGRTTSRPGTLRMNSTSSTVSEMTSQQDGSEHSQAGVTYPSCVPWSDARVCLWCLFAANDRLSRTVQFG